MRRLLCSVLSTIVSAGCGGGQTPTPSSPSPLASQQSGPVRFQSWCEQGSQHLEATGWTCLEVAGTVDLGAFGSELSQMSRNLGSCSQAELSTKTTAAAVQVDEYHSNVTAKAGAGLDLRRVAGWLPNAKVGIDHDASISVSVDFGDSIDRQHIIDPKAWFAAQRHDASRSPVTTARFNSCVQDLCAGTSTLVYEVLVGKPQVILESNAELTLDVDVGWETEKVTLGLSGTSDSDMGAKITLSPKRPVIFAVKMLPASTVVGGSCDPVPLCGTENSPPCGTGRRIREPRTGDHVRSAIQQLVNACEDGVLRDDVVDTARSALARHWQAISHTVNVKQTCTVGHDAFGRCRKDCGCGRVSNDPGNEWELRETGRDVQRRGRVGRVCIGDTKACGRNQKESTITYGLTKPTIDSRSDLDLQFAAATACSGCNAGLVLGPSGLCVPEAG